MVAPARNARIPDMLKFSLVGGTVHSGKFKNVGPDGMPIEHTTVSVPPLRFWNGTVTSTK
jgi:hypothetical protein